MKKGNLKVVEKKENEDVKMCREVVEKCGLNKIGMIVCNKLTSTGDFLLSDHMDTKGRIEVLIQNSLSRLAMAKATMAADENESSLEGKDFDGVQLAIYEAYSLLDGAFCLSCGG